MSLGGRRRGRGGPIAARPGPGPATRRRQLDLLMMKPMTIEREERHALDQRGRDDHRRLDVAGDLGLAGHALDGRGGQPADPQPAPMITRPIADPVEPGGGVAAGCGGRLGGGRGRGGNSRPKARAADFTNFIGTSTPQGCQHDGGGCGPDWAACGMRRRAAHGRRLAVARPPGRDASTSLSAGGPPSR